MNSDITKIKGRIDWWTVLFYFVFVVAGWLNIYAASFDLENAVSLFDLSGRAGMQLVWIGTSFALAFAIMKVEFNRSQILHNLSRHILAFGINARESQAFNCNKLQNNNA